jgi:hypothetical protein
MANNDYRPDYKDLWELGFVETDNGSNHPFDRCNELQLSENVKLEMDAFWDFGVTINCNNRIPILFSDNDELEMFIETFKRL